ncbi:MAG: flagellar biosynthetic protein FliO [Pseudomonadota bacterium]
MTLGALFSSLLAVFLSLALVVALAWGVLWLLKRFQDGSFGRLSGADTGPSLRFEKALPVGPRERLVLVEIEGEQWLFGVTAHAITPIKSWPVDASAAGAQNHEAGYGEAVSSPAESGMAAKRFRLRMAEQGEVE